MPETNDVTKGTEANQEPTPVEPHGEETGQPHGGTEEETDWKAEARKWEKLAKANKDAAAELEQLRASTMSEQEKAIKRAEDAESALAAANRKLAIHEAAKTAGVDESLLERMSGDTADEIAENANALKESMATTTRYPNVPDAGNRPTPGMTADDIRSIKDPVERVRARAANKELFN